MQAELCGGFELGPAFVGLLVAIVRRKQTREVPGLQGIVAAIMCPRRLVRDMRCKLYAQSDNVS